MSEIVQPLLFAEADGETSPPTAPPLETPRGPRRPPRIKKPERHQVKAFCELLEGRLDDDHPVRIVWQVVESLDLSALDDAIESVEGSAGRDASDPRVLFALCLYAAVDGVSSARELARRSTESRPYEWLRGDVPVNHHMLSDFRVEHGELLRQLQTDSLAGMLAEGLIELECAAQDGMRVRASAGSNSFRRQPSLEEAQRQAREHLDKLEREAATDAGEATLRQQKARERAAREKQERIAQAIEAAKRLAEQREKRKKGEGVKARASTTDPEARTMKMPDGGFRPGFNVQMTTDAKSGVILTMDVINEGTDAGQMKPAMDEIKNDLGKAPKKLLTDGGFSTQGDIEATTEGGTEVYTPVREEDRKRAAGKDPFAPKPGDSPIIAAWRVRMGTEAAQTLYKLRAPTAELSNARLRNQGVYQMRVRGLAKVRAVLWWHVLAINLLRAHALRVAQNAKMEREACAPRG